MAITYSTDANYLGALIEVSKKKTPFLNMMGLGNYRRVDNYKFPLNQHYNVSSGSQPEIAETDAETAPAAVTVSRAQDWNVVQIHQYTRGVTYKKQSMIGNFSGVTSLKEGQPVQDELGFQVMAMMKQFAQDLEVSCISGVFQDSAGNTALADMTRGILDAISSNTVAAGAAALSKSLIDQLAKEMADNGAPMEDLVLYCNSFQKQKISDIYGNDPMSRTEGGLNVQTIFTDFFELPVMFCPNMPTDEILIADMSMCGLVGLPKGDKGVIFTEELAKVGAVDKIMLYGQVGFDYGVESAHGSITGLATA